MRRVVSGIKRGIASFPIFDTIVESKGGRGYRPRIPDNIDIRGIMNLKRIYRSCEGTYLDFDETQRQIESLLSYLDSPQLRGYEIKPDEIMGFETRDLFLEERLSSLSEDGRILLRPVVVTDIYNLHGTVGYDNLFIKAHMGDSVKLKDIKNSGNEIRCHIDCMDIPIDLPDRYEPNSDLEPPIVCRSPVWFNCLYTGIEGHARVPLEVLRQLLEPATTKRIIEESEANLEAVRYRIAGEDNDREIEEIEESSLEKILDIIANEEVGEDLVAEAMVKMWLLGKKMN